MTCCESEKTFLFPSSRERERTVQPRQLMQLTVEGLTDAPGVDEPRPFVLPLQLLNTAYLRKSVELGRERQER